MPRAVHGRAVLQALLVTFLWSTSWVFIKVGLADIPALTFAGLRYALATLCLLPLALRSGQLHSLRRQPPALWLRLMLLGLLFYSITQGAQFLSLAYLPAALVSLLLSFTTILVAFLGMGFLGEQPHRRQWAGTALYLVGVLAFFVPVFGSGALALGDGAVLGLVVAIIGVVANALSSILGRDVNRSGRLEPLAVTTVTMGLGAMVLLATGIMLQGLPRLGLRQWAIIAWLAVVNTAMAFTLWNRTLRTLSAMESSILNNTMLFQIALLAWVFLDEPLGGWQVAGIVLAGLGTLVVQLRRSDPARQEDQ